MPAVVQIFIAADEPLDLAESIAETMISLNARHWDTGTVTLLRILAWLRQPEEGHHGDDLASTDDLERKDLGSTAVTAGRPSELDRTPAAQLA